MSLLDEENILTTDLKKKINNPFFLLKQIFISHKGNNRLLFQHMDDILNVLKSIKIPEYTKWYFYYDTIELVDESYHGELGDYYKIFACISFNYRTECLIFDIKRSCKFSEIINEFTKLKYNLIQITKYKFIYE